MKLASYILQNRPSYGIVCDDGVRDIPAAMPEAPLTLAEMLGAGEAALAQASLAAESIAPLSLGQVRLAAPIPQPPKLIGLAVNYAEHHREMDRGDLTGDAAALTPRPFLMPPTAVAAPDEEIPWPAYSREVDHEVELAVVIGRPGRCLSPQQAREHIGGYTIANDISARSVTFAEGRAERPKDAFFDWLHGKWSDRFCPLGPWLVTPDELGDPHELRISLEVDGETRQDSSTRYMIHNVFEVVSFVSHIMTLTPGDVIATGTPSGVGKATGKLLQGGQTITCHIENIGDLTNRLGEPPHQFYIPCGR
ncbi:MAG: fumarylacetoacetate hydrolase family protein [Phycisphaerae bacterium]